MLRSPVLRMVCGSRLPIKPPGCGLKSAEAGQTAKSAMPRAGWTVPSARERLLSSGSSLKKRGVKDFGDLVGEVGAATAKATQTARQTREAYEPEAPPNASEDSPSPSHRFEPPEDVNSVAYHTREHDLELGYVLDDQQPVPSSPPVRYSPPTTAASVAAEAEYEGRGRPLSYGGMAQFLAALSILAGVVATINWQWSTITGLYQHLSHMESRPQTQASHAMPSARPKFSGLVPQEQNTGQAPGAAAPNGQTAPAVAQRVVFYEEDPNDQQGRRYVGSAIWRTETVSRASGFEPEPAVRADVEIPERRMTVTWSQRLVGIAAIEITFNLPADFPGGGIANVPGILMKQHEGACGLSGGGRKRNRVEFGKRRRVGSATRCVSSNSPQRSRDCGHQISTRMIRIPSPIQSRRLALKAHQ